MRAMIRFALPSLGADMDEGTLLAWHVGPGDAVRRGQVVAVVDTSKAAVDVEIWHDGVVGELLVQPGEKVPVGTVLATILEAGEQPGAAAAPAPTAPTPTPPPPPPRRSRPRPRTGRRSVRPRRPRPASPRPAARCAPPCRPPRAGWRTSWASILRPCTVRVRMAR
jgi:pyruvate dehydrogenase E2 component (dihydrolipoamide acetyltransferase)